MTGGWNSSLPLPLPPPLIAAAVQLCQRQDWLFIHPLIVSIRDSNYPLRSSDYPELQEGDLRVRAAAVATSSTVSPERDSALAPTLPTVPGSQSCPLSHCGKVSQTARGGPWKST